MSVQDAFKVLWEELPTSARLVERATTDNFFRLFTTAAGVRAAA